MSGRDLFKAALRIGLPPISLVLAVLGSIIGGVAAPTEAASMGALGSIVVVALAGRFSFSVLRETALATTRITAGMMFILICAQVFALAFRGLHGEKLVEDLFNVVPGGVHGVLIFMMVLIFVLGFFIEWIEISYIVVPLFLPLLLKLNVDLVWVASLIAVNLQTSFLTPPFGWALFYLRSVAPPEVPDAGHLQGRGAVHLPAADRAGDRLHLSRCRDLAAARDRLVERAAAAHAPILHWAIADWISAGPRAGTCASLMTAIAVACMSWMHAAQAQPVTVDPESIVPLPDKFDIEMPAPDVPPEMARFHGAWVGTWHDDTAYPGGRARQGRRACGRCFRPIELGVLRHESRMVAGRSDHRRRRADHDGISHLP